MPVLWPRNIIPHDERTLRALGSVESLRFLVAAMDSPIVDALLEGRDRAIADDLVDAGLLAREDGTLVPTTRHRRDPPVDAPGHLDHKRAKVALARGMLDDAGRALDERGPHAHAAFGLVSLPDSPDAIAQANAILAEAEDQLRAIAEDAPPGGGPTARVLIFVGSTPS